MFWSKFAHVTGEFVYFSVVLEMKSCKVIIQIKHLWKDFLMVLIVLLFNILQIETV